MTKLIAELEKGDREKVISKMGIEWVEKVEEKAVEDKSSIIWEFHGWNGFIGYTVVSEDSKTVKEKIEPKPLFTTKHYKAIAKWVAMSERETEEDGKLEFYVIVRELAKDNPKFKRQQFVGLVNKS